MYERIYSTGAIMKRTFGSLSKLRLNRGNVVRDMLVQFHMHTQIRNREHPLSMGLGRIK
jgi:hypothetical protein